MKNKELINAENVTFTCTLLYTEEGREAGAYTTTGLVRVTHRVSNGILFRKNSAEKTRNGSVRLQKKVLIPRFMEESIPNLGTERNYMKNLY
jgi:hypothetical protein